MRKVILMMLFAAASGSAAAAWERVRENSELTSYADPATIRKSGNMVQMWVLFDYKTPQEFDGKPFVSIREQFEFDCNGERLQLVTVFSHAENMAKGRIVYSASFDYEEWQPIRRGTTNEALWKFACGKR